MKIVFISESKKYHASLSVDPLMVFIACVALLLVLVTVLSLQSNSLQNNAHNINSSVGKEMLSARGGLAEHEDHDVAGMVSKDFTQYTLSVADQVRLLEASIVKSMSTLSHKERLSEHYIKSASLSRAPVKTGFITSKYGFRSDPFNGKYRRHRGVDIAAKSGAEVYSPANGFVVYAGRKGGYGNVVEIQHDRSVLTRYGHLKSISVHKGDVVKKGAVIARVGRTGRATGPHLHLEVLKNGRNVDPELYFDGSLTEH